MNIGNALLTKETMNFPRDPERYPERGGGRRA